MIIKASAALCALLLACLCTTSARADSVSYMYDARGQLISISYPVGSGTTTITYTYDKAGNRTQQSVSCTGSTC